MQINRQTKLSKQVSKGHGIVAKFQNTFRKVCKRSDNQLKRELTVPHSATSKEWSIEIKMITQFFVF